MVKKSDQSLVALAKTTIAYAKSDGRFSITGLCKEQNMSKEQVYKYLKPENNPIMAYIRTLKG